MANEGYAYSWDDEVSASALESVVIPEGRYKGKLIDITLDHYNGGQKIGACPMATAIFKIDSDPEVQLSDRFYMWSTVLWRSAQLFGALGLPKNTEGGIDNIPPTWAKKQDDLIGRTCWVNVEIDKYTGTDGKEHESNKIKSFTDKAPAGSADSATTKKAAKPAETKKTTSWSSTKSGDSTSGKGGWKSKW